MGNLQERLLEDYEKLRDENIDIAEQIVCSHDVDGFADLLDEFNIHLPEEHLESLLSRCHSYVAEELAKFANEVLDSEKIESLEDDEVE